MEEGGYYSSFQQFLQAEITGAEDGRIVGPVQYLVSLPYIKRYFYVLHFQFGGISVGSRQPYWKLHELKHI